MLKPILLANAASCIGFGALFAFFPSKTADFLGGPPAWLVLALGLGLIANGANLTWVARKDRPHIKEVILFVLGDVVWVVASLALVAFGVWITTPHGIWVSIAVAVWVGACGV
ncbi:unnamed protein product, partial [Ectocarpus sp. 12 AP-2014]